jgi:DNA-directed RNA polymerase subunit M
VIIMQVVFCQCGSIMVPEAPDRLRCRSCGKSVMSKMEARMTEKAAHKEIEVIEDDSPDLPKTDKECLKCGNHEAWYWLIQTRAGDEPPTQFFKCTNERCKHVWREYK